MSDNVNRQTSDGPASDGQAPSGKSWLRWLLVLPFIAVLWVPFYNSVEPSLGGIPFFYWYQLLWVLISSVLIYFIYLNEK